MTRTGLHHDEARVVFHFETSSFLLNKQKCIFSKKMFVVMAFKSPISLESKTTEMHLING